MYVGVCEGMWGCGGCVRSVEVCMVFIVVRDSTFPYMHAKHQDITQYYYE